MASLQLGSWKLNGNGYEGKLNIDAIDGSGNVNGTVSFGTNEKVFGFWDESAGRLVFVRNTKPGDVSGVQVYTGYLMKTDKLAGTFEAFKGTGATGERNVFGWFATRP